MYHLKFSVRRFIYINNFKKVTHVAQDFVVCALLTEIPHIPDFTVEKWFFSQKNMRTIQVQPRKSWGIGQVYMALFVVCWPLEVGQPKEELSFTQDSLAEKFGFFVFSMNISRFHLNAKIFSVCSIKWQHLTAGYVMNHILLVLSIWCPRQLSLLCFR